MSDIDLRCGDWRDVLADVGEVDALICDPPYGARTHAGHDHGVRNSRDPSNEGRRELSYSAWTPEDVHEFVAAWNERTSGWMAIMSCSNLVPAYQAAAESIGRYAFAPVPCVIPGMTVRMAGDGPSSWAIYLNVSRPKTKAAASWGTLPGAYRTTRKGEQHIGGKPIELMNAIIRDYTREGDLVCDPCAGMATTAIACESLGRRFIGSEIDPETHAKAIERIRRGVQLDLLGGAA